MEAELKQKWIEALMSGEFEQGTGQFCTVHEDAKERLSYAYCCLGVLWKVLEKQDEQLFKSVRKSEASWGKLMRPFVTDWQEYGTYCRQTLKLLGMNEEVQDELIRKNDSSAPFSELAIIIDSKL